MTLVTGVALRLFPWFLVVAGPIASAQEKSKETLLRELERVEQEIADVGRKLDELKALKRQLEKQILEAAKPEGSAAMLLVVDRSFSMGERVGGDDGPARIEFVQRGVPQAALALQAGDTMGIVTFGNDGYARTHLQLTPVNRARQFQVAAADLWYARESSHLASGLERASRLLRASDASMKFVIVVTDGMLNDARQLQVGEDLVADGIGVTIVRIALNSSAGEERGRAAIPEAIRVRNTPATQLADILSAEIVRARVK